MAVRLESSSMTDLTSMEYRTEGPRDLDRLIMMKALRCSQRWLISWNTMSICIMMKNHPRCSLSKRDSSLLCKTQLKAKPQGVSSNSRCKLTFKARDHSVELILQELNNSSRITWAI